MFSSASHISVLDCRASVVLFHLIYIMAWVDDDCCILVSLGHVCVRQFSIVHFSWKM